MEHLSRPSHASRVVHVNSPVSQSNREKILGLIMILDLKEKLKDFKKDFNINFSSYSVDNSALIGGKHYVLISFKRNELFNA